MFLCGARNAETQQEQARNEKNVSTLFFCLGENELFYRLYTLNKLSCFWCLHHHHNLQLETYTLFVFWIMKAIYNIVKMVSKQESFSRVNKEL